MEAIIITLSVALVISFTWNIMLWQSNKILIDELNRDEEKEPENPNQMKLEFDEEDHH